MKIKTYFSLPNNRAGWNKRAGGKISQILVNFRGKKWTKAIFNDEICQ